MTAQQPMIDVSSNNHPDGGEIHWPTIRATGVLAVMIKATEGVDYKNEWLARDAEGAKAAGLRVGYYHFAHPGTNGPQAEAAWALAAIAKLPRDLGLALDLEISEGRTWEQLATWARDFHSAARKVVDHSPLYVDENYLDNLPGAPWGERLWLARTDRPRRHVWAWQETAAASVQGIAGLVDVGFLHPEV